MINVKEVAPQAKPTIAVFPKLMQCVDNPSLIVLFFNKDDGLVIKSGTSAYDLGNRIGSYDSYVNYNKPLTIQNILVYDDKDIVDERQNNE